jgi:hypothetical protein
MDWTGMELLYRIHELIAQGVGLGLKVRVKAIVSEQASETKRDETAMEWPRLR